MFMLNKISESESESESICFRWTYVSGQHTFLVCSPMTHFIVIYCVFYMI